MFIEVLRNFTPLMLTFAVGFGVLGLFVWVLAAQGAANRRLSYIFWAIGVVLAVIGFVR